ncbi:Gfo/Idh/MocA family protein [Demequina capsici]|uniref:Gfo/Idh/MocA family oxidoreductase n=1 Tax=Demequina capsici TaxID=3075620 RepID=A0AA96J7Y5_9MICO|nr:Gfo/Idh/MocA family oxidoreductase [Demequina sp. OYTSA14]WNM24855.1 Gfo/Idh/MocA family oxidoreductase [Demequina sp. OYTSA14]
MSAPLPMSAPAFRWGILGAGGIAHKLADAITHYTKSEVVAVAAASGLERAQAFAAETGVPTAYGSYEELVADPDVDIVYVATTHNNHHGPALLAIEAGKHVMVEKAFTQNERQARLVVDAARAKGVFVMEAMWARHLPHMYALREAIARGEIGEVISVQADHGQPISHIERMRNPALAGGALLDLGVYPISFAHDILGVPDAITAVGRLTDTGVDGQVSMVFDYPSMGAQASLTTTMEGKTPCMALIGGTEGYIEIDGTFYNPTTFRVVRLDGTMWEYDGAAPNGFQFEAAEVSRCVAAGLTESPIQPLEQSLEIMRIMDEVRNQIGLIYPDEHGGPGER